MVSSKVEIYRQMEHEVQNVPWLEKKKKKKVGLGRVLERRDHCKRVIRRID